MFIEMEYLLATMGKFYTIRCLYRKDNSKWTEKFLFPIMT